MIVSIDNGYFSEKAIYNSGKLNIRSKYEKAEDKLNKVNTNHLIFEGNSYLVGEGATEQNLEYDKTNNDLHKLCTYTALSRINNITGVNSFDLVVSYPLGLYANDSERYVNYLRSGSDTKICCVDGNTSKFRINNITAFPQGVAALYNHSDEYKNKIVGVIDIGGNTIIGAIFDNLNLIRESMFTERMGGIILQNRIKKRLDSEFSINIARYEIQKIIKEGLKRNKSNSLLITKEVIDSHCMEIKNILRSNSWNIEDLEIFITGGSSLWMGENLKSYLNYAKLSNDPIWDNAKGLYKVGETLYG